jgi:hypothetical protein
MSREERMAMRDDAEAQLEQQRRDQEERERLQQEEAKVRPGVWGAGVWGAGGSCVALRTRLRLLSAIATARNLSPLTLLLF